MALAIPSCPPDDRICCTGRAKRPSWSSDSGYLAQAGPIPPSDSGNLTQIGPIPPSDSAAVAQIGPMPPSDRGNVTQIGPIPPSDSANVAQIGSIPPSDSANTRSDSDNSAEIVPTFTTHNGKLVQFHPRTVPTHARIVVSQPR